MQKVLVTGANGYIGRHVVAALLEQGCEVFAADVNFDGLDERANRVNVDIFGQQPDIYELTGKPDVCIHLAWRNGFVHNAESHVVDLPKHYMFLRDMMAGGLKQLVVMGSMHEVGYWEGAIDEHTPTNPMSLYAVAKNSLRQMMEVEAANHGVVLQWIRGFYIYGDDLRGSSIFGKILKAADEGQKKFPFTTGKNLYDFITVEELGRQIAAVALQTEVCGIINCCSGKPVSLGEQIEKFIREHELDIKLDYGKFPDRKYDSPGIWGDASKIQQILLGYK